MSKQWVKVPRKHNHVELSASRQIVFPASWVQPVGDWPGCEPDGYEIKPQPIEAGTQVLRTLTVGKVLIESDDSVTFELLEKK